MQLKRNQENCLRRFMDEDKKILKYFFDFNLEFWVLFVICVGNKQIDL